MADNPAQADNRQVRIVSKSLYPYAKRALDLVKREHEDGMTIMLYGAEVSVGADSDGNIVIFTVSRDYFNIDVVERALRVFVRDLKDDETVVSLFVIIDKNVGTSQKSPSSLINPVK